MDAATLAQKPVSRVRVAAGAQVAIVVVALYVVWAGAYLAAGHDVRDFIRIGTVFIAQGDSRSRAIHLDPGYRPPANQNPAARGVGYDGQFSYYIALDPGHARYYLDNPSYRYSRILYPAVARAVAFGQRSAIPWTLLLINLLAIGGGTWGLATWLRRRRVSPWWALIYGLWPGMIVGMQRDLSEPLAYGLVVAAVLLLDTRGRWRLPLAGLVFGLAGLARQTTLVFPLVYGVWLALGTELDGMWAADRRRRWLGVIAFLGLSLGPLVAYLIFLDVWLGAVSNGGNLTPLPFAGLVHGPFRLTRQGIDVAFVVVPTLVALAALAPQRGSRTDQRWLPWSLMVANVLLNIVFFAQFYSVTYTAASRQGIGVVVSALICLPYLGEQAFRRRRWIAGAAAVAMIMVPVVAVYGFTNVSA